MSIRKARLSIQGGLKKGLPNDIESAHALFDGTSSRNSSKPPSSDSPEQRSSQRQSKPESTRKRGAQLRVNDVRISLDQN